MYFDRVILFSRVILLSVCFKSFRRGAADAAAGSWKSAAPLGRRAEAFGELVLGSWWVLQDILIIDIVYKIS